MSYVVIAPVSTNVSPIYVGIKEFPTERIILLCVDDLSAEADKVKEDLKKFKIPVIVKSIQGPIWEELFRLVSEIAALEDRNKLIVNVGSGDPTAKCAMISASFVNGLKAFDVVNDKSMLLPVLKFSYYKLLTDKKLSILKILEEQKDNTASLNILSEKAKMSLPLLSYHINGTLKSDGLKQLGLIDVTEEKGSLLINLNTLGKLLIKGYIQGSSKE